MITDAIFINKPCKSGKYEQETAFLKAIVQNSQNSSMIQRTIEQHLSSSSDYASLAYTLTGQHIYDKHAQHTINKLFIHKGHMEQAVGRPIGIKCAALDFIENMDHVFNEEGREDTPTYEQLARMAFYDPLTGLPNYRFFTMRLSEEVKRAQRYKHLVSLAMIDIDQFKAFNDTYGHPEGNRALQHASHLMRSTIRDTDIIVRYGGDEFACIFPETTKLSALRLVERIRRKVKTNPIQFSNGSSIPLTLSIGLATYPRDALLGDLLNCADKGLYLSKKHGRNRITAFIPQQSVVLRYKPKETDQIISLSVVGTFNGWHHKEDPMHEQSDKSFSVKIHLVPGSYQYKFLINGTHWIEDPTATEYVYDGYKGRNSVLTIPNIS
ncbi:MAG: diguanylate cyclase [Chlamydiota bacterium]|nr:diguanylate cyclase [Chlamydiota bacterium]